MFRTRQAVRDLVEAVRLHRNAMSRLGITGAERQAIDNIIDGNCKLTSKSEDRVQSHFLLAAALPDDDFPAFIATTCLLLANKLQDGRGDDDLFWNWDAFRDHYRLADAPVRAAIMNGFRTMHETGRVALSEGPSERDCLSATPNDVMSLLENTDFSSLARSIHDDISASDAGKLWQAAAQRELPWQALMGFRHLYEREASIAPGNPDETELIPWA